MPPEFSTTAPTSSALVLAKAKALDPHGFAVDRAVGAFADHVVHPDRRRDPRAARILARSVR